MEDSSIKDYIQTMAALFKALTSEPIDHMTIQNAKIKYPIPETLTMPNESLFDNPKPFYQSIVYQILYTIENNYDKMNDVLSLQHSVIMTFFIESLRVVAKHSKLYNAKEIKFYFSLFRDIFLCPPKSENLIKNFLIHLSLVGKTELSDLMKPFLQKTYYKYLVDIQTYRLKQEEQIMMKNNLNDDEKYNKIESDIKELNKNLQEFNFYEILKKEEENNVNFKLIDYDDTILFQMIITYFPYDPEDTEIIKQHIFLLNSKMQFKSFIQQECDNFMKVFYSSLYSEVLRKKFAHIMKSETINNYYLNLGNEDQQIKNNYAKFISFIDENNGIIPQSAIDHYIIPLTMRKGVHGVTTNYQRIAINSYYKCFKMKSKINKSDKGFENLSVKDTLFIASLIVIGLHESNHFLRRYGQECMPISSVITPRKKEGGEQLIKEIFGDGKIAQLYLKQAKLILDISSWKNNIIKKYFESNAAGPSMKFIANTPDICFRCQ